MLDKLHNEEAIGMQHEQFWKNFGEPFFDQKKLDLFEAFKAASSDDERSLRLIKMQLNVLEGMEAHFMHYIDTGKMARTQILAEEKLNDH